jgi:sarcosine oxidase subunit alpha
MKDQPNRLDASIEHKFSGDLIDRARPIRFTLNGAEYQGFEGDTVLSAVLAAGVDTAGTRFGEPMALDPFFSPPVIATALSHAPQRMLPMNRAPAVDGQELISVGGGTGARGILGRLSGNRPRSLGQVYDHTLPLPGAWVDLPASETVDTDVLVIGGGIAGLSAAVRAAQGRARVMLVERGPSLGGDAEFWGVHEGEGSPDTIIGSLITDLKGRARVTILTNAEVVAMVDGGARMHQIVHESGMPEGRILTVTAPKIILATGGRERLPVFSGNRLPGVTSARTAFLLARRYGIWAGRDAVFNLSINPAYRLVMLAHEAGIAVQRLTDTRLEHRSSYLGYAQALAIPMAPGLVPAEARLATGRSGGIEVRFSVALDERGRPGEPVHTSLLVTASSELPELTLWMQAGGGMRWNGTSQIVEAEGSVPEVELAGLAAGYFSFTACRQSGDAAAERLAGSKPSPVSEVLAPPEFESPNGPLLISSHRGSGPAYLERGSSLSIRRPQVRTGGFRFGGPDPEEVMSPLNIDARALDLGDVAAKVQLGEIAPEKAGAIVAERCVIARKISAAPKVQRSQAAQHRGGALSVPKYLAGRFGSAPERWTARTGDHRRLSQGALVFPRSDVSDPERAIGVVLEDGNAESDEFTVLIEAGHARAGEPLVIRGGSGPVPAKLVTEWRRQRKRS